MKINKIVIAEPSPIVAAGLLRFFEDLNQIQVVSVVDNISDLNDKMIVHNPDMLIVNPIMLGYTNNNALKQISQISPECICIALVTTFVDKSYLRYFENLNQIQIVSVVDSIDDLNDKIIVHSPDMLIVNPIMLG